MDIQERIKVMQAFSEGKPIQSRFLNEEWKDNEKPTWNWEAFSYRVKPESILPKTWEEFCDTHPINDSTRGGAGQTSPTPMTNDNNNLKP